MHVLCLQMKSFNYTVSPFRNTPLNQIRSTPQLVQNQVLKLNDYGMLNRAVSSHLKKQKKKKKKAPKIYADNYQHCRSLDKMQLINSQKNQEIKRHILQKAEYAAELEEVKLLLRDPGMREHKLLVKIRELEEEVIWLKCQLGEKDQKYRVQIERMRKNYEERIDKQRRSVKRIEGQRSVQRIQGQRRSIERIDGAINVVRINNISGYQNQASTYPQQDSRTAVSRIVTPPQQSPPNRSINIVSQSTYQPAPRHSQNSNIVTIPTSSYQPQSQIRQASASNITKNTSSYQSQPQVIKQTNNTNISANIGVSSQPTIKQTSNINNVTNTSRSPPSPTAVNYQSANTRVSPQVIKATTVINNQSNIQTPSPPVIKPVTIQTSSVPNVRYLNDQNMLRTKQPQSQSNAYRSFSPNTQLNPIRPISPNRQSSSSFNQYNLGQNVYISSSSRNQITSFHKPPPSPSKSQDNTRNTTNSIIPIPRSQLNNSHLNVTQYKSTITATQLQPKTQPTNRTNVYSFSGENKDFGEGDMQEIFKRYCISD